MNPTQERIKELYIYDESHKGLIHNSAKNSRGLKNGKAGHHHSRGYVHIGVDGKSFKEHILVWIYFNGAKADDMQIDHINGIKWDNRISNLRQVSGFDNQKNRGKNKKNTSGYKGVHKNKNKWEVSIMANNIRHRLGHFDNPKEAALVYNEAAKKLHGAFAYQNEIK